MQPAGESNEYERTVKLNRDEIVVARTTRDNYDHLKATRGNMSKIARLTGAAAAGLTYLALSHGAWAESASANDTARFLAGMEVPAESSLAKFARDPGWQQHARYFDSAWKQLERRQLSKIRPWTEQNLKQRQPTLFYMFSGPDFVYAEAFFPGASTYVLAGLEPVGPLPEITERTRHSLPSLHASLNTVLNYSFFITADMRGRLGASQLPGTLPILYVFLARAGKTIREVSLVSLDNDGLVQAPGAQRTPGVKIVFSGAEGANRTLYYFRTDLSDGGVRRSGFLQFCDKFGAGDALLKSASYLMHSDGFSKVRQFVLDHSRTIVQDDSGIPLRSFKPEQWERHPYGTYIGPIEVFGGRGEAKLRELFRRSNPPKLEFGVGYRWRGHDSNLLVAVKKSAPTASQ